MYTKAEIQPSNRVCLWLGANVMVEYTYEEAKDLLETNLTAAKQKLEENTEDIEFLTDQVTTTEVNMARVYNFDVLRRKKSLTAAAGSQ